MTIYMFQSVRDRDRYALTSDPEGAKLPFELGPWESAGQPILLGKGIEITSPDIAEQIETYGFALFKAAQAGAPAPR